MERGARWLLTLMIGLVAASQFVQVFSRYILQTPVMGLEEATVYASLWLYMLGAANASRENSQIRANVIEIFIKTPKGHALAGVASELVSLMVSVWLTWWAWDFIRYSLRTGRESVTLYWPTLYADLSLLVGLVLVTLFTVRTLWHHIRVLIISSEKQHA